MQEKPMAAPVLGAVGKSTVAGLMLALFVAALDSTVVATAMPTVVSVNLFFTSFAKQARRSRKGGFTGCTNVFSPIPVTA